MVFTNILEKIGNTPIIQINRIFAPGKVKIFAKIESFNPGGSVKERIALSMIEAAEEKGELSKDKIVLEATSGNTGIGLAMVCAVKGYRCLLVMPESASIERRKIMLAYGADILLTPAKRSTDGAIEQSYIMAREHPDKYFLTDQFNNDDNWRIHYRTTGPEIWGQTDGQVTDVVSTLGTTGTAMGLSRYFNESHPHVRVTAMEPFLGHKIQGLKNMKESYQPGIFDKSEPYQITHVADQDAFRMARRLAREEGLLVGMSSGAAMCAALEQATKIDQGVVVVILPDGGERYLSTALFTKEQPPKPKSSRLRLYNSMSKKKEIFKPQSEKKVTFYGCGPTAHEHANLSHCRRFIVFDLIHRALLNHDYEVTSFMNFTDLDDNTIAGAEAAGQSLEEFTQSFIEAFKEDIDSMGVLKATGYPLASNHVVDMLDIAKQLIDRGYAYEKHGSIYFDISRFKKYGQLSGVDIEKIQIGKTVDLDNYEKDNPVDFTLLKRSTLNELKKGIFFQSEWGNVRPGWHLECAAMSTKYLGDTIDIHTSGSDLMFPHHENEIAIAESMTNKPLANYWLHNAMLLVDGKKMSKEAGSLWTLRDILAKGYTGREVRYFLMSTHYRKPLSFTLKKLDDARKNLERLDEFCRKLLCLTPGMPHPEVATYLSDMEKRFFSAIDDDLNISRALGRLFDFIKRVNPILNAGQLDIEQKKYILETLEKINCTLNVLNLKECPLAPEIDKLIREREEARKQKDWKRADTVRDELTRQGFKVSDTTTGPVWAELEEEAE